MVHRKQAIEPNDSGKAMKRVREDASAAHNDGEGPSKRSASAARAGGTDAGRRDTAASPIRAPSALVLRSPRQVVGPSPSVAKRMSEVVSKNLDAHSQANFFRNVQADDQLAEVAYQRDLLITFIVSGLAAPDTLVLDVPEFATVAYLKRRATKAKLEAGEWCPPDRFELKRRLRPGEEGTAAEPLTEINEHHVPNLLFNLGYRAGQNYELTMISATAPAAAEVDRAHQETLLRAVAMDPASMMILSNDPNTRSFQQLLQNVQQGNAALQAQARAAAIMAPGAYTAEYMTPQRQQQLYAQQAAVAVAPHAFAAAPEGATPATQRAARAPRVNRAGRWSIEETQALIIGVQAYGMSWSRIQERFKGKGINELRTPVDYKDKWRNLVKAASDPIRTSRTQGIDEDMKTTILRLAKQTAEAGGRGELDLRALGDGEDTHSGMGAPGTGGIMG